MSRRAFLPFALVLAATMLTGCSYTPARIDPEPLIVIGDDRGGYHSRSHGGYFCPPGQAKKGRC
ncbi:hypothetical protein SAMN04487957_11026 [Halomonas shengliensis]|uniref:Lipoprotein n=1 Tax=Halomonas shengliensis TaxID=419597 RepID=A0A1H0LMG1_9GAMM|nr:hypothetical protein [Halomonas shengliensis]SDO69334.1 hypothetical protein SAMN04487957_11026 [Halomonas shengliensis]